MKTVKVEIGNEQFYLEVEVSEGFETKTEWEKMKEVNDKVNEMMFINFID